MVVVVVGAQHLTELKLSHLDSGRAAVVIVSLGTAWCKDAAIFFCVYNVPDTEAKMIDKVFGAQNEKKNILFS